MSAHFLIRRDGELIQFVPCGKRAWHAGESNWRGRSRCNDFSIGIELEGADDVPFEDVQYERLAELTRALKAKYPIADIVGHSDIAPGRKTDPGPCFDWARLPGTANRSLTTNAAYSCPLRTPNRKFPEYLVCGWRDCDSASFSIFAFPKSAGSSRFPCGSVLLHRNTRAAKARFDAVSGLFLLIF